jgi:biotin synthase
MLVKVEGTPLEENGEVDPIEFVRIIATARIIMPKSYVRLSAGRKEMSDEMQALCFLAGANSIFAGEKLLTTPNPGEDKDQKLIEKLGMSFKGQSAIESANSECAPGAAAICSDSKSQEKPTASIQEL